MTSELVCLLHIFLHLNFISTNAERKWVTSSFDLLTLDLKNFELPLHGREKKEEGGEKEKQRRSLGGRKVEKELKIHKNKMRKRVLVTGFGNFI